MRKELELIGLEPAKAESLELVISLFLNGNLSNDPEESLRLFGHYTIGLADKINHYWEEQKRIEGLNQVDRVKDVVSRIAALRENTYTSQTIKNKQYGEENQKLLEMETNDELNTAQEESLDNPLAIPPIFDRRDKEQEFENNLENEGLDPGSMREDYADLQEETNQCRICGATSVKRDICGECQELGYEDDSDDNDSPDSGQGARLEPEQPVNPQGSAPAQAIPLDDKEETLAF